MEIFFEKHSGEVTIVILFILVAVTLLILTPKLLRSRQLARELEHAEHLRALEKGLPLPYRDEQSAAAGRTASLVPMVVICAAGTVTCFLAAYKTDSFFAVTLAVWTVAGVVSLAAITGGVALVGRLAQLKLGEDDEAEAPEVPPQEH